MEDRQISAGQHRLVLTNREAMMLTGVTDILSFDVNEMLIETELGMLMIRGKDLHVNRLMLEKGEADVSGNIDAIQYSDISKGSEHKESFFGRLFR